LYLGLDLFHTCGAVSAIFRQIPSRMQGRALPALRPLQFNSMNRFLSYWLSPIAAALLAGFVLTVIAVGWWSRVPADARHSASQVFPENYSVFPAVASAPITAARATAIASNDIVLMGTVLPRSGVGARAAFRVNGKPIVVDEGKEIVEGLRLEKVSARSVGVSSKEGGREIEMVVLKNAVATGASRGGTTTTTAASPAAPSRVTLVGGCNATPTQRKDGIVLASELLAGALQNPTGLATLLNASTGKLVVQNSAGLGALIGLRDGDVLRTADGKPLTQANDLIARVLQPVSQAQAVTVEITRETAPQVLHFLPPGCRG
jgi:hypothetical protein